MCARAPIGRKEFAVAVGLWAFLLASGAARSAGQEVGSLDQKAARAAEGALASLDAREAERVDELTRSAAGRVKQDLAGVVERRLLPPPSGSEEFVAYARREVSRSSTDAAAGTASEITPPASVDGSSDPPSTIAVRVAHRRAAHSPAIAVPELPPDMAAWCRESTRGR